MKNYIRIFIIAFSLLFLSSCEYIIKDDENNQIIDNQIIDNQGINNEEFNIVLNTNDICIELNETIKIDYESNVNVTFDYNDDIIDIYDDVIHPKKKGSTKISLMYDDKEIVFLNCIIYKKPSELLLIDALDELFVGEEFVLNVNNKDVIIEIEDNNIISYDEDTKIIKGLKEGKTKIIIKYLYDEELYKIFDINVIKKELIEDSEILVVNANYDGYNNNQEVMIGNVRYYYNVNLFSSLKDAIDKAIDNDIIKINSLIDNEVNINKSNIKIVGDLNQELDLIINIDSGVSNIKISKLLLKDSSKIKLLGGNKNITIDNNKFSNTKIVNTSWVSTNKYQTGLIEFVNGDIFHDNINIINNEFNNIGDCGINVNNTNNLNISNNKFNGFSKDAVRLNNGKVNKECYWNFLNNYFSDGVYSGIFFRTYSSDTCDFYHFVSIRNNYFDNCGKSGDEFSGAVVFKNYQEGGACIDVSYNEFKNCSRFIFLRNNAIESHQANFVGYVVGNIFYTIPSKYYFNNLNSSDSFTLNPIQTKLIDNVFLDGNGKDITPNNDKFIGCLKNSFITLEKHKTLEEINLNHVLYVDNEYELKGVTVSDNSLIEYKNNKLKILKDGICTINKGETKYEVVLIKRVELVVRFINIALHEVGYQEMDANGKTGTSGNYTKYGAWYGINPGAWCAMFVSWCANQAGVSTTIIPKYASVSIGMQWYQDRGWFKYKEEYTPKAGDIMFMKSSGASHTGIVLYCDGVTLYTVEGNSSDMCALRKYSVNNAKITGYGLPQWSYYSPDGYDFSSGKATDGSSASTT